MVQGISSVQWGCSVHYKDIISKMGEDVVRKTGDIISTQEKYHNNVGKYHQYCLRISSVHQGAQDGLDTLTFHCWKYRHAFRLTSNM